MVRPFNQGKERILSMLSYLTGRHAALLIREVTAEVKIYSAESDFRVECRNLQGRLQDPTWRFQSGTTALRRKLTA